VKSQATTLSQSLSPADLQIFTRSSSDNSSVPVAITEQLMTKIQKWLEKTVLLLLFCRTISLSLVIHWQEEVSSVGFGFFSMLKFCSAAPYLSTKYYKISSASRTTRFTQAYVNWPQDGASTRF